MPKPPRRLRAREVGGCGGWRCAAILLRGGHGRGNELEIDVDHREIVFERELLVVRVGLANGFMCE